MTEKNVKDVVKSTGPCRDGFIEDVWAEEILSQALKIEWIKIMLVRVAHDLYYNETNWSSMKMLEEHYRGKSKDGQEPSTTPTSVNTCESADRNNVD